MQSLHVGRSRRLKVFCYCRSFCCRCCCCVLVQCAETLCRVKARSKRKKEREKNTRRRRRRRNRNWTLLNVDVFLVSYFPSWRFKSYIQLKLNEIAHKTHTQRASQSVSRQQASQEAREKINVFEWISLYAHFTHSHTDIRLNKTVTTTTRT